MALTQEALDRGPVQYTCPLSGFQKLTGGKHKLRILWALRTGPKSYGDLRRETELFSEFAMAPRVFSRELVHLREAGLIERSEQGDKSRQTQYRLTSLGSRLVPLLGEICNWSLSNLDIAVPENPECVDA